MPDGRRAVVTHVVKLPSHPIRCLVLAVTAVEPAPESDGTPPPFAPDWTRPATEPVELNLQLSGVMLFERTARLR